MESELIKTIRKSLVAIVIFMTLQYVLLGFFGGLIWSDLKQEMQKCEEIKK